MIKYAGRMNLFKFRFLKRKLIFKQTYKYAEKQRERENLRKKRNGQKT